MPMKSIKCLPVILLAACSLSVSSRTVISRTTREPVAYAGVGIVNRNLGTVTDTAGHFALSVPNEYLNDTLRISSVGFVSRSFAVRDFKL